MERKTHFIEMFIYPWCQNLFFSPFDRAINENDANFFSPHIHGRQKVFPNSALNPEKFYWWHFLCDDDENHKNAKWGKEFNCRLMHNSTFLFVEKCATHLRKLHISWRFFLLYCIFPFLINDQPIYKKYFVQTSVHSST